MRKRSLTRLLPALLFTALGTLAYTASTEECTTAIISGAATNDGRPLLWKNRDTSNLSNKVVYVDEKPFRYLAIVNARDTSGRIVWGGLNSAGFAIMNSVSYNLPEGTTAGQGPGIIMADALRTCATVDDFEAYIKKNLGPRFGSRTNFGVIDAHGGAASFETSNLAYQRFNASDEASRYLLRTNFSVSGKPDQGAGYVRFDRESALFKAVAPGAINQELILQNFARDLGNPYSHHLPPAEWKSLPADTPYWIHSNYTIDRVLTASTMVVHGVANGDDPQKATLWVILGEPVCSIAVPLWVSAGETPAEVREGKDAPIASEAARLKGLLRPMKGSDRHEYLDVTKLDNRAGTGWLPGNLKVEKEILDATEKFVEQNHSPAELAAFEKEMAAKALARLSEVK